MVEQDTRLNNEKVLQNPPEPSGYRVCALAPGADGVVAVVRASPKVGGDTSMTEEKSYPLHWKVKSCHSVISTKMIDIIY